MKQHWAHKYIGREWVPDNGCWTFCREVFLDQWGILLPVIAESGNANIIRDASHDIGMRPAPWAIPMEGDLCIMRSQLRLHAGCVVVANGHTGVLHSTSETGVIWQQFAEAIEGMTAQLWRRK